VSSVAALVEKLHAGPAALALAVTGGGSLAISHLLTVPGASRTVLECVVPYGEAALAAFLGGEPEQCCSARTARAMAVVALLRAMGYMKGRPREADSPTIVAGVSCTASLATNRPKRGPHRAHLAVQTLGETVTQTVQLFKGARTRAEEEELVAQFVLNLMAETAGIPDRLPATLRSDESAAVTRTAAMPGWGDLLTSATRAVLQGGAGSADRAGRVLLAGAFHPRHEGHRKIAEIAATVLGRPVEHEISIVNVDKPPLDYTEMADRAGQFQPDEPLWFTRAATFEEKSELFPSATFVVGADTIARIAQERYYGNDPARRDLAIAHLAQHGASFLVFARRGHGRVETADNLDLPAGLRRMCRAVPPATFCMDVSSTEMRARNCRGTNGEET
jgi:nicotinic acid mononucleotide adenylyltransferase